MSEVSRENLPPDEIDYFGGCPHCRRNDGYLNAGPDHWFVCHEHKVTWCVGANLFSSWRHQTDEEWQENIKLLKTYEQVEPLWPPIPEMTDEEKQFMEKVYADGERDGERDDFSF